MQAERETQENVPRPLPVDTTGDSLPNSRLLAVEIGEVRMEPV